MGICNKILPDKTLSEEKIMTTDPKMIPEVAVQEKTKQTVLSASLKELISQIDKLSTGEEKIRACFEYMRGTLSDKTPRFKDYWEAKKLCLPLFKEALAPHTRTVLWGEYIEISTEARHLKTLLDEQSAFAMEQIDLAIQAVEADLARLSEIVVQSASWELPSGVWSLQDKKEIYSTLQSELQLLNDLAGRINSLRKEVIRTEMRIRFKNKFFERLSKAGDAVFPRRKELISKISAEFLSDMKEFAKKSCSDQALKSAPIFEIRDEIKNLQMLAKELTLDTQTFNETRMELSKCWDLLKEREKDRKKEMAEKQETFKKNVELVLDKIKPLSERCAAETFSMDEASKQSKEILSFMKTVELSREDIRFLKEELDKAKAPVYERAHKEQQAREKEIEESQRQRLGKIEEFKKRLQETAQQVGEKTIEELQKAKDALHHQLGLLNLTHAERELLEQSLKELRDLIIEKREKAISSLSMEEQNSLQHLNQMLEEWESQKQEIRTQLETYRKALAGSGFDFEKAMRYRELLDSEKARLDKVNEAIEEIENKIDDLENT